MGSGAKQIFIRRVTRENQTDSESPKILWSRHAVSELAVEGWKRRQVEDAPRNGGAMEDYSILHRPLPDCLVLAWLTRTEPSTPVHVAVAIHEGRDRILVVTVYDPADEEWEDDWKTRK
jgi:hypothetical protein